MLGIRPLSSPDIGYHLAYGQEFLRTGKLVDHNDYVFLGNEAAATRAEPGPGCWYDADGHYRFPNANWLTQVILAAIYQAFGFMGLCVLQALLTAGAFAAAVVAMRRLGLGWLAVAVGVLLIALASYERLVLRPEMLSYLLLAIQLAILMPAYPRFLETLARNPSKPDTPAPPLGTRALAAVVVVQLLMSNLHSYFLLGLVTTGALFGDAILRMAWARITHAPVAPSLKPWTQRLAILLGLQIAVCFANPWTWRMVLLPFQTLLFLREHDVGQEMTTLGYPWQMIGEFWKPLGESFAGTRVTYIHVVLLVLAAAASLAAIVRRRWAYAMVLAAMAFVSMSMRRNVAPASILLTPVALASLFELATWVRQGWPPNRPTGRRSVEALHRGGRFRRVAPLVLGVVVAAAGMAGAVSVWTQAFYSSERSQARFGWGISRMEVPTGAVEFIRANLPGQRRIWTDFFSSSNVYFLTGSQVPVLTNTWAYPPDALGAYFKMSIQSGNLVQELKQRQIDVAVVRVDDGIASRLQRDASGQEPKAAARELAEKWAMVYFDGVFAVFVNPQGTLAGAAAKLALPGKSDHLPQAIRNQIDRLDPQVPAVAWHTAGLSLHILGWNDAAIEAFEQAIRFDDGYFRTWDWLGSSLGNRAMARAAASQPDYLGVKADLARAAECFQKALEHCDRPASRVGIQRHLERAQEDLLATQSGRVVPPAP